MASLERRIACLEAAHREPQTRAELIRASLLPASVAESLDDRELRGAVHSWRRGDPFGVLRVSGRDYERAYYESVWFPTPTGWRAGTPEELAEYQAALKRAVSRLL